MTYEQLIGQLSNGELAQELEKQLEQMLSEVARTKAGGALTLTIEVKPEKDMVAVAGKIAIKMPSLAVSPNLFYLTDDGRLMRNDPRQLELRTVELKTVAERGAKAVREIKEDGAKTVRLVTEDTKKDKVN